MREFVRVCEVWQSHKYDQSASPGLLQPIPVPESIFTNISMDFITRLPKWNCKDALFVVVDQLSKYGHLIDLGHPYSTTSVAQVFVDQVYKLHGLPNRIVSDQDPMFVRSFW